MRLALTFAAAAVASATISLTSAQAQEAPAITSPYNLFSVGDDHVVFTATGTIQRSGNLASVTVIVGSNPTELADSGFARLDIRHEFDCRSSRYRTSEAAAYDAEGGLLLVTPLDEAWAPVPQQSFTARIMTMACSGEVPADSTLNGTPVLIAANYREWVSKQ